MLRIGLPLVLLVGVVFFAVVSDRPLPRADFVFTNGSDVKTLDPQRMRWLPDMRVARMVYEGLIRIDVLDPDYAPMPGIAERWEQDEDGLTWTFHLREDAVWSDGSPNTAHDFVFAWRRAILPDTASSYAGLLFKIEGTEEFFAWRQARLDEFPERVASLSRDERVEAAAALWAETEAAFDEMVAIDALDDHTLRVRLAERTPYFLDLVSFPTFYPVHRGLVTRHERLDPDTGLRRFDPGWTKPDRHINNGPFSLERWRFKRDMRFAKNPNYWAADRVAIDSIEIPSVEDDNAAVLAFETGVVDWVADLTVGYRPALVAAKQEYLAEHADEYRSLEAEGLSRFEIEAQLPADDRNAAHAISSFATYWYNFNCQPALPDGRPNPFHDARVRRAFAMMIDKQSLVENVLRVGQPVARALIPDGSIAGYTPPNGILCLSDMPTPEARESLIAEARALLAEAGYEDMSTFPTVQMLFNKDAGHDVIAQAVGRDWQRTLGVEIVLDQKELSVFSEERQAGIFVTSRGGWYGDYADPTTFLDLNRSDNGNNDRKYRNDTFDAMMDAAQRERDPQRRLDLLAEAERFVMEVELPMVPTHHYVTVYLFDPARVAGLNAHPRTMQDVSRIDIAGDGKGRW